MKTLTKLILLALISITLNIGLGSSNSFASNVSITTVSATATAVTFTISMKYSWNVVGVAGSPNNWDAVWVFVKYNDCSGASTPNWKHLNLSTSNVHTVTGGSGVLQADPVTDGVGVFIRRTAAGSNGSTAITGTVTLTFASALATANYQFKVFGIEMVSVPTADFQVGDGSSNGRFNSITITSAMQTAGIPTASTTLGGTGTLAGTLPAAYPMGTNKFYCMKYKITSLEYLDFLNTLTYDQQAVYHQQGAPNNAPGSLINTSGSPSISIVTSGNASTIPKIPATYTTLTSASVAIYDWDWKTYLAYLDWAGLRPMTEMEFEKACRGTLARIADEHATGTTYTSSGNSPSATSTRAAAGATYYGILQMSITPHELIVNTTDQATAGGSAFTGALGNGALTSAGLADAVNWPDNTNTSGGGGRKAGRIVYGGVWIGQVSFRVFYNTTTITADGSGNGVRGVRQY